MRDQPKKRASQSGLRGLRAAADTAWVRDELRVAWRDARDEAVASYRAWRDAPGAVRYVSYRAAQDRADAAQDALAEHCR